MKTVGAGVYEVRVATGGRAFRAFYVAKFEETIYVLHAFEKKTERTARKDLATGRARYRQLVRELASS